MVHNVGESESVRRALIPSRCQFSKIWMSGMYVTVTETYIPLIQIFENWQRDGINARLTLSLSPTLCTMLLDPLLRGRYEKHLNSLIELAEKEIHRTHWDRAFRELAWMYHHKFSLARE